MVLEAIGGNMNSQDINNNFSYLDSKKVGKEWMPFLNVMDYGAIGDGQANDTAALQAAIDDLPSRGGTIMLPVGIYQISSTLIFPEKPIEFIGVGGRRDDVTIYEGTHIQWVGEAGNSVIRGNHYLTIKNIIIENINSVENITGFDFWTNPSTSNFAIINCMSKGCSIGFAFQNCWYNYLLNCQSVYADIAYKIGDACNNTSFYTCHANHSTTGVKCLGDSKQVLWSGCSFERCSDIALDLSANEFKNWYFLNTYFEANNQCAVINGENIVIDNAFVNLSTPPAGKSLFEVQTQRPVTLKDFRVDGSSTADDQLYSYTGPLSPYLGNLEIGKTYKPYYLAGFLKNNLEVFESGLLDVNNSNVTIITTDVLDASSVQNGHFIVPNYNIGVNRMMLVGIYLLVTENISGSITLRAGNAGSNYDQFANSLQSSPVAGIYRINVSSLNEELFTEAYHYKFNNTSATSGKYKMMFLIAG